MMKKLNLMVMMMGGRKYDTEHDVLLKFSLYSIKSFSVSFFLEGMYYRTLVSVLLLIAASYSRDAGGRWKHP